MFKENDKVMVSCRQISDKDELAVVCGKLPFSVNSYEVILLKDHKPGRAFDDVRTFNKKEMRLATPEEIKTAITEWETTHNYKLS